MRLVFVTQTVDADDPVLGATVAMVRALAGRCESLHVLALSTGRYELPANVVVSTFGAPTRFRRGLRYARALAAALRRRPDGILAHMCPIYLVLAAPLAKPLRTPLLLWYSHESIDRSLRVSIRLATAVLSVDRRSFPLESPKVLGLGHGIDTTQFAALDRVAAHEGPLRLLALGRTSGSKGYGTMLDGFEVALARGLEATLEIRGPSTTAEERRHRAALERRIGSQALRGRVRLEPPLPRGRVPALLRDVDALVNATRGFDKAVYESAACAVPVLAANPHFGGLLDGLPVELRFEADDAADLARILLAFAAAGGEARVETGRLLRRRVEADHSVETWADGVMGVLRDVRSRPVVAVEAAE